MKKWFLLVLLLSQTSLAQAITFDIWGTGIPPSEVVARAQKNNLPLRKSGMISPGEGFNAKLVSGDANSYSYTTTLLNQGANIDLLLSPKKDGYGQYLYEIKISFHNIMRTPDFPPYMLKLLQEKYGRGKSESNMIQKILVWNPDRNSEVRYWSSPGALVVSYTDKKIAAFAAELRKATHDLPKQPMKHPDAKRF